MPETIDQAGSADPGAGGQNAHPVRPATAAVLDFVGGTIGQIDRLLERLQLTAGGPGLPGCLFQWTRSSADGLRIVEVWQSAHHFEYFLEREILPAIEAIGMPD